MSVKVGTMDTMPQRVLNLVNVSTSMSIVRFLSTHLNDFMGVNDTILYSILVIQASNLFGKDYTLMRLSRRVSYLLIVEKIRPFATAWSRSNMFLHLQSLLTNALIITATALVPQAWAESSEGAVIITSVQFMYCNALNFVIQWRDIRISIFVLCVVVIHVLERMRFRSHVWSVLSTIGASISVTIVHAIITDWPDSGNRFGTGAETRLLYLAVVSTMAYGCAFFLDVAESTRDYLVFLVASEISAAAHGTTWIIALFMITACLRQWPGSRSWITQCVLIVIVNVIVESVLSYIEFLAVHDTFITLKTSALVLQFLLHEMALGLIFF